VRILLVDDEPASLAALAGFLRDEHDVDTCDSGSIALARLAEQTYQLLITDLSMPAPDGFDLLEAVPALAPGMPVVVVTGLDTARTAVQALRLGARDFLVKPASRDEVRELVRRFGSERDARDGNSQRFGLIGRSGPMRHIHQIVPLLARCRETVLITGETGTGKDLLARAIHAEGPRAAHAFIAHNMAATPEDLTESVFFGHVRGAFTGATQDQPGLFERADGGTLFLDEVDSFPLPLQAKLLRVLEGGVVRRIGARDESVVDVRVIASSAVALGDLAARNRFRSDLYFRLRQLEVTMPPLRDHLEDLPLLVEHFLAEFETAVPARPKVTEQAMGILRSHLWPGNCRELCHALRSAHLLAGGQPILPGHLPRALAGEGATAAHGVLTLASAERGHILQALEQAGGNRSRAAKLLGIDRGTLTRKIRLMDGEGSLS
jgi:DNA-binding NtrC family response regulator